MKKTKFRKKTNSSINKSRCARRKKHKIKRVINKNIIIFSVVMIILLLLLLLSLIMFIFNYNSSNNMKNHVFKFDINDDLHLKICPNKKKCDNDVYYNIIEYSGDFTDIKKIVRKFNKSIIKDYNNDKKYEKKDNCTKDNNDYYIYNDIKVYNNTKYTSLTLQKIKHYICSDDTEQMESETYFYSNKENRFLTTDEIRELYHIDDYALSNYIKLNLYLLNNSSDVQYTYENTFQDGKQNIKVYYGSNGKVLIEYISNEDGEYHFATVK